MLISDATLDLVDGFFETESEGEKLLRGVSRPVRVHRVIRPTDAVDRLEVAGARRLTPLVGRDAELDQVTQVWDAARQGRGAVVHVTGEAGIGKSRLIRELVASLEDESGAVQVWQCSAHLQTTMLHPVIRFLEHLLALDALSPPDRLAALRGAVVEAALDPAEGVPLLADLLSIRPAQAPGSPDALDLPERRELLDRPDRPDLPDLGAREMRTATLNLLEQLLVADPRRHPLLLIVEDLHWADPTTVELLDRMIANPRRLPVMCVLTLRPDFEARWTAARDLIEIQLGPLTSEGVRALAAWASPKAVDPAVLEWVDATADGVPLFVEETLKMLEQSPPASAAASAPVAAGVPSTLQGLLTERLDRLPDLGDLIDVAAVLGREFDRDLLETLWPRGSAELEPALVQLAAHDVLRPVAGTPTRCEFTHALLQEAAYGRILRRHRQALHGRVARSLVASSVTVAEREPEVVAHHWSCAAQPAKAVAYWHAAGTRALERAAFREASHHFRRGLEALDAIGGAAAGDRSAALDAVAHAERHIETTGEALAESELHRLKGRVLMAGEAPDPDRATAAYERSVAAARRQNARLLELSAASRLAVHQSRIGEAPTDLDRVAELCDWFGAGCDLPDVVRARRILAAEST